MTNGARFRDLFEQLDSSQGTEVVEELRGLKNTIYTVNRNFEKLDEIDQWFLQQGFSIQEMKHRGELDDFYKEYLRRLHNYIVSVYSLISQTQRLNGKYGSDEFDDVYTEGMEEFGIKKRWKFLEQLRHYIQKRHLPSIDVKVIEKEEGIRYGVVVDKSEMVEKGSFKGWGRDYLETRESEIDIQVEVREYHQNVNDFYSWYYDAFEDDRDEDIEERTKVMEQIEEKRSSLFDGLH